MGAAIYTNHPGVTVVHKLKIITFNEVGKRTTNKVYPNEGYKY